jgi:phosphoserine phosphatase
METSGNVLTGNPVGTFCFEDEKRIQLIKYCSENNLSPDSCYYYGDSVSDLPALEAVGNPVCVTPDKKLLLIAERRNWKVLNW